MKTVSVPTDWLKEVDGLTVADAIAYLSTLPQDYTLTYWQSAGDDQGVEISSELEYQRPYTEQELAEQAAERKAKRIKGWRDSIAYYTSQVTYYQDQGKPERVPSLLADIERLQQRIKDEEISNV